MSQEEKRGYTHIQAVAKEVLEMLVSGKIQREVSEYYGFKDKYVVKISLKGITDNSGVWKLVFYRVKKVGLPRGI